MKITFLLIVIVIFTLSFGSCNNAPTTTTTTTTTTTNTTTTSSAVIDYHMYFSEPQVNLFVTPEIKNQKKYVKISYTKDWSLTCNADWLDVSPKEGLANAEVLVTITTRDEPEKSGQYETEIRVESKDHVSYKIIPVTLNIVTEKQGQIYDIPTNFEINDIFPGATEYHNTSAKLGILESSESSRELLQYDAGDPCIIISAEFTNNTNNQTLLHLFADGFDENGVQTSWCISRGPLVGMDDFDLPAHQSTTVNLLLSWANKLSRIQIQANVYDSEMLKPIPATPSPESEMARIWFDEEWLVKNDMEPSPTEVRITFPKKWLETGKSDSFNGTGIELAVPRQMLLDHNVSTNPDEITVLFPIDYFNGRSGAPVTSPVK